MSTKSSKKPHAVSKVPATYVGSATLMRGDCVLAMRQMLDSGRAGQIDSIVTDPPYGLGFAGTKWDGHDTVAFNAETWELAFSLLKPGGHLVAFGGARTVHRLACAVEDAGFDIRDQLLWLYGTGMPRSLDVSKQIDRSLGVKPRVIGRSRVANDIRGGRLVKPGERAQPFERDITKPSSKAAREWEGWGTKLKPCHEPILLARRPLSEKSVASNVLLHRTGALNLDGCRVISGTEASRSATNVMHDGSVAMDSVFPGNTGRYFYSAKATREDKTGSSHLTVKPLKLMRWLVRLVTPPAGLVFDPFAGSGTTIEAALLEGARTIGCEITPDY